MIRHAQKEINQQEYQEFSVERPKNLVGESSEPLNVGDVVYLRDVAFFAIRADRFLNSVSFRYQIDESSYRRVALSKDPTIQLLRNEEIDKSRIHTVSVSLEALDVLKDYWLRVVEVLPKLGTSNRYILCVAEDLGKIQRVSIADTVGFYPKQVPLFSQDSNGLDNIPESIRKRIPLVFTDEMIVKHDFYEK